MGGCAFHRLRQPGHNVHCFYGDELENFDSCCRRLMKRIKTIIPDGCPRARIRATSRVTRRLEDGGTLGDTLGDEARGMVVVGERVFGHRPPNGSRSVLYAKMVFLLWRPALNKYALLSRFRRTPAEVRGLENNE